MDATSTTDQDAALAAQGRRARRILLSVMALMIALPVLLFLVIHD